MAYNLEAFRELGKWVDEERHHENAIKLDMEHWVKKDPECGTTMCIAGYAVHKAGGEFIWSTHPDGYPMIYSCELNGGRYSVEDAARMILGLSESEGFLLFNMYCDTPVEDSLAFFSLLHQRAERGERNMTRSEIEHWQESRYVTTE